MKVSELIERLNRCKEEYGDVEVMILDGFNGGGEPRDLNLGPTSGHITHKNAEECADCQGRVGERIIVLGYGCY